MEGKLKRWEREDKDRKRRLTLMTSEEFAEYYTRTKGRHDTAFRKLVDAEMRRRDLTPGEVLGQPPVVPITVAVAVNPEIERLEDEITRLKALKAEVETAQAAGDQVAADELDAILITQLFGDPPTTPSPAAPAQNGDAPAADDEPGFPYLKGVFE